MKQFSFIAVVVLLFVSFFGVSPAQALEPISPNSAMLTECSTEELANLYRYF